MEKAQYSCLNTIFLCMANNAKVPFCVFLFSVHYYFHEERREVKEIVPLGYEGSENIRDDNKVFNIITEFSDAL